MIPDYEDEVAALHEVARALSCLARESDVWDSNLAIFQRQDMRARILWWRAAKKQAQLGAPAMQTLMLKVIELKLTR